MVFNYINFEKWRYYLFEKTLLLYIKITVFLFYYKNY
jgi:hypothetical protein